MSTKQVNLTTLLNLLFLVMLSLGVSNCTKEPALVVIDTPIQPYFARFEVEGNQRGKNIDLSTAGIKGELTDITEKDVNGQCVMNGNTGEKIIRIDKTYWAKATDLEKEFVVFHELGHCYLGKRHIELASRTGTCVSIMHSGLGTCRFSYQVTTRAAYLDELFQ